MSLRVPTSLRLWTICVSRDMTSGTRRDAQGRAGTRRDAQGRAGTRRDAQGRAGTRRDAQGRTGTHRDVALNRVAK